MTTAERNRQMYARRKQARLCVRCGAKAAHDRKEKTLTRCGPCLDRVNLKKGGR